MTILTEDAGPASPLGSALAALVEAAASSPLTFTPGQIAEMAEVAAEVSAEGGTLAEAAFCAAFYHETVISEGFLKAVSQAATGAVDAAAAIKAKAAAASSHMANKMANVKDNAAAHYHAERYYRTQKGSPERAEQLRKFAAAQARVFRRSLYGTAKE